MTILTRYLYVYDDVKVSLMISLLNKNQDHSLFWAYELYYSGFITQFFDLIWKIYYDFYSTLNPGFTSYIIKKQTESTLPLSDLETCKLVANIILNLLIRPYNLDMFILSNDNPSTPNQAKYFEVAKHIQSINDDSDESLLYYLNNNDNSVKHKKLLQTWDKIRYPKKRILLSYKLHQYSIQNKLQMGKNWYIHIDSEQLDTIFNTYSTKTIDNMETYAHNILKFAVLYHSNESKYHSLFQLEERKQQIVDNWLYYASFSPIWNARILQHTGTVNHATKQIEFSNIDSEESFHTNYNYEPDEQSTELQKKCINPINISPPPHLTDFYNEYNKQIVGLLVPQ